MLGRGLVGGVDLLVVVGAALELPDLVVGHVRDELLGGRGLAEEVVADEPAGLGLVGLEVAVEGLVHDPDELAVLVLGEQLVPLADPQHLDHVPAGAAEEGLELLDDLAVAAHRPVQALQVAVDDEREVVELVVGGQLQQAARLRLVHLAVAQERQHVLLGGVLDHAVVQVAVELRLVDRVHRADAHGHGRELPEVGHGAGVRVGGQPVRGLRLLLPETVQLLLGEPALEIGARVVAGGRVALPEDLVAAAGVLRAAEEVVEAHLVEGRHTGVGGDVTTHADLRALGPVHHHGGVPAQERTVAPLDLLVARELRLLVHRDRVHVVRGGDHRHAHALRAGVLEEGAHDVLRPFRALRLDQALEGLDPLPGLLGVGVLQVVGQATEDVVVAG